MRAIALLTAALLLAGCASAPEAENDGKIHVVASTNVYGDIAAAIGGDAVEVTSIVSDPAQDPHSVEGSVRTQLALAKADVVIMNGGGYDDWVDILLAGAGSDDVKVLNVTELSGVDTTGTFNEHLWFDFDAVETLAAALAAEFGVDTDFGASLAALQTREEALASAVGGAEVVVTEPVPLYLLEASGLRNVTPVDFSEAIEESRDVSPAALAETLRLIESGEASLLVYNEQTTSPETEKVKAAALEAGVPVVAVTETLPPGVDYLDWMTGILDSVADALGVDA